MGRVRRLVAALLPEDIKGLLEGWSATTAIPEGPDISRIRLSERGETCHGTLHPLRAHAGG